MYTRIFAADFETTVYDNQTDTEVWASACVEMGTEDVHIFHTIEEQFDYFFSINTDLLIYFHNLKFDGNFILSYLLRGNRFTQACITPQGKDRPEDFLPKKFMKSDTFIYSISDLGQWYSILIKRKGGYLIEIRDSLKLLPFSLRRIGKSFKTKHQKLDMKYSGYRYAGCPITQEEQEYIANDVLVLKEALEFMYSQGHDKLTIGSCCLQEYKTLYGSYNYKVDFPNLYEVSISSRSGKELAYLDEQFSSVGEYIHKSYRGGWCYLAKGKENKQFTYGFTADVNSLYPSMMHSQSGNRYPVGLPRFYSGKVMESKIQNVDENSYYFIRIKTRFTIKAQKLPFIQIKGNFLYKSTEMLVTSDIWSDRDKKWHTTRYDKEGNVIPATLEMVMTMTDYELFREHYDVSDFEILDGCFFEAKKGLFDSYIDKYKQIKMNSKGAMRELAKLFLNNLYGKMAASTDSSYKVAYLKEDKSVGYYDVHKNDKRPGYIPVGTAITSYARAFTIRAAQLNYYGPNKPGFVYADTDSIHCNLHPDQVKGIKIHPAEFCCWKLESYWDLGQFVRQKTYIEHVTHEDGIPVEETKDEDGNPRKPYYNVRCAGLPERCKDLFLESMKDHTEEELKQLIKDGELSEDEIEFLTTKHTIADFKIGLKIPGKLLPKIIPGGVLLTSTTYEMR